MADHDLYADVKQRNGMTWDNDVIELFLKPSEHKLAYYEFQVNPANTPGNPPYNPIYGKPGASYRAGGGPGQSRAIGGIADRSAFAVGAPNFGAFQDFRTIRIGVSLIF